MYEPAVHPASIGGPYDKSFSKIHDADVKHKNLSKSLFGFFITH